MTFHGLVFAAVLGLAGVALLLAGLWSGYAALGTSDAGLGRLALALAIPGLVLLVLGVRWMNRELAKDQGDRADRAS